MVTFMREGPRVPEAEIAALRAGTVAFVPKGARRSTRGGSGGFAYLTVHRRRGPLRIGSTRARPCDLEWD